MEFKYSIDECDVVDKDKLRRFRSRLTDWYEWMMTDPEHSIWTQINRMLLHDTVYWTINEARGIAINDSSQSLGFNGAVSQFIDQSYVATQLLSIRRLTEKSASDDSISLTRILRDLEENAHLFTREIYVCHDGRPFDPQPAKTRFLDDIKSKKSPFSGDVPTEGPEAWYRTESAHKTFDGLCGSDGKTNSRDQLTSIKIFDQLRSNLDICFDLNRIASKFIAHAADAKSRGKLTEEERQITYSMIIECQKVICLVATFIYGRVLQMGGHGLIPHIQYGHLKEIDKAWVTTQHISELEKFWYKHCDEVEAWTSGDWVEELNLSV